MSKFDQLTEKLASERTKKGGKKVSNPRALAAYIGRQKYGEAGMEAKAKAARAK